MLGFRCPRNHCTRLEFHIWNLLGKGDNDGGKTKPEPAMSGAMAFMLREGELAFLQPP
jgi:hypothetical protein